MRATFTVIHRWAGLFIAVFLAIAGLTGAVISWDHELDEWLNPHLYDAKAEGAPLPPLELVEEGRGADPRAKVTFFPLQFEQGHNAESLRRAARRSQDRRALSRSTTTRSSSTRLRERSPASATGAPSRSTPRTSCRSSTSSTTRCTFRISGASTAGACGSWASSASSGCSTVSSASTSRFPPVCAEARRQHVGSEEATLGMTSECYGRRDTEIMVAALGPGVEDQARRLELPPQPRSASRLRACGCGSCCSFSPSPPSP